MSPETLVTGASGFLGRALVARLRADGRQLRILVRHQPSRDAGADGISVICGDLRDPDVVARAVQGAAQVFHLGAATSGTRNDFDESTVRGTRNVLEACRRFDVGRLIYVSSLSVLDHAGRKPSTVVGADYPFEPYPEKRGHYTRTKVEAEQLVRAAIRSGAKAVIVRPGQIVGPGAERRPPNGTVALLGGWMAVGPARQTLPLIYVDDLVDALVLAGRCPGIEGHTFNLVDPTPVSHGEFLARSRRAGVPRWPILRVPEWMLLPVAGVVTALGSMVGRESHLTPYRVQSLRPLANVDIAAMRRLGWQPRVGIVRGLGRTFGSDVGPYSDNASA